MWRRFKRWLWVPVLLGGVTAASRTAAGESAPAWTDYAEFGRFAVYGEARIDRRDPIWKELVGLPARVEKRLGLPKGKGTIRVFLLRSRAHYNAAVRRRFPDGTERRALYIQDGDRHDVYVYQHLRYATDLRHEAVHAVLHQALPYLPLWLDEGLAAYFETPAEKSPTSHAYLRRLRWDLALRWHPNLRRLELIDNPMKLEARDYRECWAWAFFLLDGGGESSTVLQRYFEEIRAGRPPGRMSDFLAKSVPEADAALVRFIQHRNGLPLRSLPTLKLPRLWKSSR